MKAAAFEYHRPASAEAAVEMLAQLGDEAKVLAGGQSLVPVMAMRLGRPEHLVDVNRIAGLGWNGTGPSDGPCRCWPGRHRTSGTARSATGARWAVRWRTPALANAVRDALAPLGVRITAQPLTPEKIIGLIEAGRPLR